MSAVKPKTVPPKPKTNSEIKDNNLNIFSRILRFLFGTKYENKQAKKPRRYYNKNRRYNKNYKFNKYKSNNKKSFARNTRQK